MFRKQRRQTFLDEESYKNTIAQIDQEQIDIAEELQHPELTYEGKVIKLDLLASNEWRRFLLRYTAGDKLPALADSLSDVVARYEAFFLALNEADESERRAPFRFADMLDYYVDYLNLISAAYLLRRPELVPRIAKFYTETAYDQTDAVIEELLKFTVAGRPELDEWTYEKPYRTLLDAIDGETPAEMAKDMKKYVKSWYPSMKGRAHFWGKHEKIKPEFTPYDGYWAMCAAAFTFLFNIDDFSYRDEIVYPKDMADYARELRLDENMPGLELRRLKEAIESERIPGGQACTKEGYWFSPAIENSRRYFKIGEIMPSNLDSSYGVTFWQWSEQQ